MNSETDYLSDMLKDMKGKSWADIDEEEYKKSSFNVNEQQQKNNGLQRSNSISHETPISK